MKTTQETLFNLIEKEAVARGQVITPDFFDEIKEDPAHKIVLEAMQTFGDDQVKAFKSKLQLRVVNTWGSIQNMRQKEILELIENL